MTEAGFLETLERVEAVHSILKRMEDIDSVLDYAGRASLRGQALSSGSEVKTSVFTHPACRDALYVVL